MSTISTAANWLYEKGISIGGWSSSTCSERTNLRGSRTGSKDEEDEEEEEELRTRRR